MGFGLSVQVVQDPVAADLRVGAGTFGWAGAYGCNVNIDPREQMVSLQQVDQREQTETAARFFQKLATISESGETTAVMAKWSHSRVQSINVNEFVHGKDGLAEIGQGADSCGLRSRNWVF